MTVKDKVEVAFLYKNGVKTMDFTLFNKENSRFLEKKSTFVPYSYNTPLSEVAYE